MASVPTPPGPAWMRTCGPCFRLALSISACQAVNPTSGMEAAERQAITENALELAVSDFRIQKVDTSSVDLDQYVILPQLRIWHVISPDAVGASVAIEDECLH